MQDFEHLTAEQYHNIITAREVLPEHQNIRIFVSTPRPPNPHKDLFDARHSPAPPPAVQDS